MTPTVLIPSGYLAIQIFTGDELIGHSDKRCGIFNEKYPDSLRHLSIRCPVGGNVCGGLGSTPDWRLLVTGWWALKIKVLPTTSLLSASCFS